MPKLPSFLSGIVTKTVKSVKPKKRKSIRKHPSWVHWYDSITPTRVRQMCRSVGMRSTDLLAEELRGTVNYLLEYLMDEPLTMKRIHSMVPEFMRKELDTDPVIDERAIKEAYPTWPDEIVHEVYLTMEGFLITLIKEGAEVAKSQGLKSIQAKHVNKVRLKYFMMEDPDA